MVFFCAADSVSYRALTAVSAAEFGLGAAWARGAAQRAPPNAAAVAAEVTDFRKPRRSKPAGVSASQSGQVGWRWWVMSFPGMHSRGGWGDGAVVRRPYGGCATSGARSGSEGDGEHRPAGVALAPASGSGLSDPPVCGGPS